MVDKGISRSASNPQKRRIGELLVAEGLITKVQLEAALTLQRERGGRTVENLIALKHLDSSDFIRFLSRRHGVASINLEHYVIPRDVIDLVPTEFSLEHEVLPIDKMGKNLTVGMACPLDSRTIATLEEMTGLKVRPLLVSSIDIREALDRYYLPKKKEIGTLVKPSGAAATEAAPQKTPPEEMLPKVASALTFEGIVHLVRKVKSLPALPETIAEVRKAMEDSEMSTEKVAGIISKDPSLSAKMISLANSAAFAFTHHVDNVRLATTLLGLREVYSVVLSSAVVEQFEDSGHFDYKEFWRRSMFTATAARIIAKTIDFSGGGVFAAGLLHDLGKVVFAEIISERYAEIDQGLSDAELIAQENATFGIAHPEAGYLLATEWDLPIEIAEPMRFHHDPAQAGEALELVAMVSVAARLAEADGGATEASVGEFATASKHAVGVLGLSEDQLLEIARNAAEAFGSETE